MAKIIVFVCIIFLVVLMLASMAGCGGGDGNHHPTPTRTPRSVCAQTGSGGVRCFNLPDYPKLTLEP